MLFQVLIGYKVRSMGWHAATSHDISTFVEAYEAFFTVQSRRYQFDSMTVATCLHVGLNSVHGKHSKMLHDTGTGACYDMLPERYIFISGLPIEEFIVIWCWLFFLTH